MDPGNKFLPEKSERIIFWPGMSPTLETTSTSVIPAEVMDQYRREWKR